MKSLLTAVALATAFFVNPAVAYQDSDEQWLLDNPDHVVNPPAEDTTDPTTLNNGRDDDSDPVVSDPVPDTGLNDGRTNDQDTLVAASRSSDSDIVECRPTYEIVEVEKVVYIDVPEYVEVEKIVYLPYKPESRSVYDAISQKLYVYNVELYEGPVASDLAIPFARFDLQPDTGDWKLGELELPEGYNGE